MDSSVTPQAEDIFQITLHVLRTSKWCINTCRDTVSAASLFASPQRSGTLAMPIHITDPPYRAVRKV
jgi:hypothetical protein